MQIIRDLADYVESGRVSPSLADADSAIGEQQLTVVAISILEWLACQKRWRTTRPLRLSRETAWCSSLTRCLEDTSALGRVFCVSEGAMDFRPEIDESTRDAIRTLADAGYQPPLMSKSRDS